MGEKQITGIRFLQEKPAAEMVTAIRQEQEKIAAKAEQAMAGIDPGVAAVA